MKLEHQQAGQSIDNYPPGGVMEMPAKWLWRFDKAFGILDLALLGTAVLLIFTDAKVFFFHVIFIFLTLGAFYWRLRAFAWRAAVWVMLTTLVVFFSILTDKIPPTELAEIPLLSLILVLVFFIARQRAKAEVLLRHSEDRYHTLFDNIFKNSRDAIFITGCDGNITDVNQAVQDLFGCGEEELVGQNFQTGYLSQAERNQLQQELQGKESVKDFELTLFKANGVKMNCLFTANIWRSTGGDILGTQGIIRDITAQKQAEATLRESESRYRRLVELSFQAVANYKSDGTLVSLNTAGAKLLGAASPQMVVGRSIYDFVHPDYLETVKVRVSQMADGAGGAPLIEEQFVRLDGSTVDVEVAAVPITYQLQPAVEIVIRDISDRKRAIAEREQLLKMEHEQRLLAETLGSTFLALTAQTSRESVLDEILRQVQRAVPFSAANIALIKDGQLHTLRHQGYNHRGETLPSMTQQLPLQDLLLDSRVVNSKKPLVIADVAEEPLWITMTGTEWIRSSVIVPICVRDEVIGLLRLDSDTPGQFSTQNLNFLQPLSTAAALTLEKAQLYDQARQELAERRLVEQELRELSARNQAIVDILPDSFFHLRRDGTLLDFKLAQGGILAEFMGGLRKGSNLKKMLMTNLVEQLQRLIEDTLASRTTQIFEYQLPLPHNTRDFEVWLIASGTDEVFAIVRDATERKAHAAALEKERARIARDLHDSLGQSLGYLRLKLDGFTSPVSKPVPEFMRKDLVQMRDVTNEAYELVRSMIATALPVNSASLATVLLAQAQSTGNRSRFKVALASNGQPQPLSPIVQQQFLYLFTEALNNVAKHAGAKQVDILLDWSPDYLTMRLTDDGCGFDISAPQSRNHFGLTIMQDRAAEINSILSIKSGPGHGTELTLQVPLDAPV